jgi:hypothetical protein
MPSKTIDRKDGHYRNDILSVPQTLSEPQSRLSKLQILFKPIACTASMDAEVKNVGSWQRELHPKVLPYSSDLSL